MYKVAKQFSLVFFIFALGITFVSCGNSTADVPYNPETDVYKGWRLGMQAYSFNRFTFVEAVEKTESLGLGWMEIYRNQTFSDEYPDVKTNMDMSAEMRQLMKQRLEEAGIRVVNFGVVPLPNDEAECRKVFDFAKEMGIETIASEPPEEALDMIERLAEEYQINVAIHNHPKPSHYWNPETVLRVTEGRSSRIGACADTGHWMRSGIDPVEALKMLEGRIISLHLKDLNQFGVREAHDVPWGTGVANMQAILEELDRQGYRGTFSIEYEHNWENSVPEIQKSVAYFNSVAKELS